MTSILNEIKKLRKNSQLLIDTQNGNRYRVILNEPDGTRTAFYFSTPVYNIQTKKAVDMKFDKYDDCFISYGSNAKSFVGENIRLENAEGYMLLNKNKTFIYHSENELCSDDDSIFPTTNGIAYKAKINNPFGCSFELEVDKPFMEIRSNDKYFSLMSEMFRPFVTISCIGTLDDDGIVLSPAQISFEQLNERKYRITLTTNNPNGKYILFEANLYEAKLFQDTTVESNNPHVNNAFGTTAFIGNTAEYGEQWLYTRPDYSKFSDLMDKKINKAIFHLPKYNISSVDLKSFKVSARFCSFGSNWNNRIAASDTVSESHQDNEYHHLDIKPMLCNNTGRITHTEGIIIKPKIKGLGFATISTGDSYFAPQIVEINYK